MAVAKEAKAEVAMEPVIPSLHQTRVGKDWVLSSKVIHTARPTSPAIPEEREARLDLAIWTPAMAGEMLVDVTVRNPLAARYVHRAASKPGHALEEAARDKRRRYGDSAPVMCAGIETYGRTSEGLRNLVHLLDYAADAVSPDRMRRSKYQQWMYRIQIAMSRAVARNVLTAHDAPRQLSTGTQSTQLSQDSTDAEPGQRQAGGRGR